ncbi:4-hydroxy-tetrahydrodipicolinate synthase [Flexithrix dorotheae]|uniref:4-hydroxy-tetrahydrodipicolinate synthase n=1 Tax=Flexithrix dorotheae TaxID=70993 RepID=UPI00037F8CD9|nr:4-hydroxy-tetrahydrodipicolinate synthase [Flexithrix dorotheae]
MAEIKGSIVALVTPFKNDNREVDFELIEQLVNFHAENGTAAIVPCGTTGESPTISPEEHIAIVKQVVKSAKGTELKVIAGTGSNSTAEAMEFTSEAQEAGADACLIVVPYYNKPTPAGLKAHFSELNKIDLPMVLYNIPGRTGINVSPKVTIEIAELCSNLIGVKASNGNLEEITELAILNKGLSKPLSILSGDDALTLPICAVGGSGVISVAANIVPQLMSEFVGNINSGNMEKARELNSIVFNFSKALLSFGANPMGIKAVMNHAGYAVGGCRLPLTSLEEDQTRALVKIWEELKEKLG